MLTNITYLFNIVKKKWYSEIKNNNTYQKKVSNVTEEIENLLIDSIKIRLRSDVPLGITLSGGVDSSVAAFLLKQEGFDVTAGFMRNWEDDDGSPYCNVKEDFLDAAQVADKLGINLVQMNFAKQYKDKVFSYFLDELNRRR